MNIFKIYSSTPFQKGIPHIPLCNQKIYSRYPDTL